MDGIENLEESWEREGVRGRGEGGGGGGEEGGRGGGGGEGRGWGGRRGGRQERRWEERRRRRRRERDEGSSAWVDVRWAIGRDGKVDRKSTRLNSSHL